MKDTLTTAVRWIARGASVLSLGLLATFIIGEGFNPLRMTLPCAVSSLFFPIAVMLGMVLAWRWEGWGGAITLAGLAVFHLLHCALAGRFPSGIWFVLFSSPGVLFLLVWFLRRGRGRPAANLADAA